MKARWCGGAVVAVVAVVAAVGLVGCGDGAGGAGALGSADVAPGAGDGIAGDAGQGGADGAVPGDAGAGGQDGAPVDAADGSGPGPDGAAAKDTAAPQDVSPPPDGAAADATVPDDAGAAGLPLPTVPEHADVVVAWSLQTTPGVAGVQVRTVLPLADGDLLVGGSFAGTVEAAGSSVTASETPWLHHLILRVGPDGTLRALRHACDGCLGPAAEAPDGTIATATYATTAVGNPGTDAAIDRSAADAGCVVTLLSPDGTVTAMRRFAEGYAMPLTVAPAAGGWLVAGTGGDLLFGDGTAVTVDDAVFYPGQAFVAKLAPTLEVEWVETIGGTAASSVSMVVPHGQGFAAVGDFGGYPIGATADFPGGVSLEAVSSDDDPAHDVFVALWDAPGDLAYARRFQHYGSAPRKATWLTVSEAGAVETLVDVVGEVEEKDGELFAGYGGDGSLRLRYAPDGTVTGTLPLPLGAMRWPGADAFVAARSGFAGADNTVGQGDATLTFTTPAAAETAPFSLIVAQYDGDGRLGRAGQLLGSVPGASYPPTAAAVVPRADGSFLLVLHGSPPLTLEQPGGPLELPADGYERLVVLRASLQP